MFFAHCITQCIRGSDRYRWKCHEHNSIQQRSRVRPRRRPRPPPPSARTMIAFFIKLWCIRTAAVLQVVDGNMTFRSSSLSLSLPSRNRCSLSSLTLLLNTAGQRQSQYIIGAEVNVVHLDEIIMLHRMRVPRNRQLSADLLPDFALETKL